MRTILLTLLLCFLTFGQAQAQQPPKNPPAQDPMERAKQLHKEGEDYFKLGEFQKALDSYKEGYKLSHKPLFLLNIGQCHFKLGQYEEAKHSYEAMLREDPNTPYRAELEEKIVKMQELIEEERAKQEAAATQMAAMSQPIIINTPAEPPKRKGLMLGGIAGGVLLGGAAASYFLFIRDDGEGLPAPDSALGDKQSF